MKHGTVCLTIALMLASGCSKQTPEAPQPPAEQVLPITLGGFLQGGDERQTLDGVCRTDATRSLLTCDIYNGLLQWKITELDIRISWYPYSDNKVRDYRQKVSIPPLNTGTFTFRLGLTLPEEANLHGHLSKTWHWLIASAKGVHLDRP
jgi:hypothetical protein